MKTFCDDLLKKYEPNIKKWYEASYIRDKVKPATRSSNIDNIFEKIDKDLEGYLKELNAQYKDIVTFKDFKIQRLPKNRSKNVNIGSRLFAKMSLSLEDAREFVKKEDELSDKMKQFFLGFYNKEVEFKYVNNAIIDWPAHKFEEIVLGNWHDSNEREKNLSLNVKISGVTYRVWRNEIGSSQGFEVIGNEKEPLSDVEISSTVANLRNPFKIGSGIKSIKLKGDEIVDLSEAKRLESIDITESNKYMVDKDGSVCEVSENGVLTNKQLNVPSGVKVISKQNKE